MSESESRLQGWKDRCANYEDRIAELEAERDEAMVTMYHEKGDKEQAEAERDALRRCGTCGDSFDDCGFMLCGSDCRLTPVKRFDLCHFIPSRHQPHEG